MGGLYKTTIVVWSKVSMVGMELESIAYEATEGIAYCSDVDEEYVEDPTLDPDWDGTEFFVPLDELEED